MFNRELYLKGMRTFETRYTDLDDDEYKDMMEDLAWNAYNNDNYKIESIAEGYFLITEVYGDKEATEYLNEHTTIERVA